MMMDEIRSNHDPKPSAQESAWLATNPLAVMVRLFALASLAVAIGLAASHGFNDPKPQTTVASRAP